MVKDRVARQEHFQDRFFVAAGMIVLAIVTTAAVGDGKLAIFAEVVVQSVALMVVFYAAGVSDRTLRITGLVVTLMVVLSAISIANDGRSVAPMIVLAVLALAGPVVIVRRVRQHARIDLETVAASLCVYLLAGLFFAFVFRTIDVLGGPFFAQPGSESGTNYVYYSFVTLTTLGYGDLTARTDLGRMLSISEALLGQLYLVSVVALLVANLGRERRRADPEDPFADASTED